MSGGILERHNETLLVFEQLEDGIGHSKRLMPGHLDAHFSISASRGEVDAISTQFRNALIKERANSDSSIWHVSLPTRCLDSGRGHSTACRVNTSTNILMVNEGVSGISPTPTEQGERAA